MSEQPQEDREPPRLQDTTERSALPLPLPDGSPGAESAPADPPPEHPAPVELTAEETTSADESPADKAPAVESPAPASAPEPATFASGAATSAAAGADGAPASFPPPFDPFSAEETPRPEVLVGAAFVGGLALALLIKRLGR